MTDDHGTNNANSNNNHNTIIAAPSTPSWMTDQRCGSGHARRQGRAARGYGRRFSGVSGGGGPGSAVRGSSTNGKIGRRRRQADHRRPSATPFGTSVARSGGGALDFDDADDDDGDLERSAHARLQGRGRGGQRLLPPRHDRGARAVDALDQSAHARLEGGGNDDDDRGGGGGGGGGLDLIGEFEDIVRGGGEPEKKKRPGPTRRPPRARAAASRAGRRAHGASSSTLNVPEIDSKDDASAAANKARGGNAKRSRVAAHGRRPGPVGAAMLEENVHPNDAAETPARTRRSSRLAKKTAPTPMTDDGDKVITAQSSSSPFVAARSGTNGGTRANSKKRSATSASGKGPSSGPSPEPQRPSPPKIPATGSASSSSASFSSAVSFSSVPRNNSSGGGRDGGGGKDGIGRAESFSSLARRGSGRNWAGVGRDGASSSLRTFHTRRRRHGRSVSAACISNDACGTSGAGGLRIAPPETPAANRSSSFSSSSSHHRSISCGENIVGSEKKSPPHASFLSPEGGISTPSVGSTSSRKRRTMDFASSSHRHSPHDGQDLLCGSERTRSSRRIGGAAACGDSLCGSERTRSRGRVFGGAMMDRHDDERGPVTSRAAARFGAMAGAYSPLSNAPMSLGEPSLDGDICLVGSDVDDNIADERKDDLRDRLSSDNDESMMSAGSDDDDDGSTNSAGSQSECHHEDVAKDERPRAMTDAEIFERKSSHEDLKFLARSLHRWARSSSNKGASMGLNNWCLVAVPPDWSFERRAEFARWAATAFGFRVGSVGGAGGGAFLRCADAEGRAVLARLRRILNDYKAGRLASTATSERNNAAGGKARDGGKVEAGAAKPKAKLPIKLSSTRPSCSSSKGLPTLSMSPFCDNMVGDLLADDMKGITLDEKKPARSNVPQFIRSMTLQPISSCFRNLSPNVRDENSGRRSGGGFRLPRLSSESAIHGSDFISQLHGMGSPSPLPNRFPRRLRERASRALQPPALRGQSSEGLHSSVERPGLTVQLQGGLKPFESPHPRNNCLDLDTPRVQLGLETPMPRQVENWGSRPILGKDWGESVCCRDGTIGACNQIFAKSWFTSEFYGNEDLSAQYKLSLDEDDESSLFELYDADADINDDDDDSELVSINNCFSLDELPIPTELISKKIGFVRCDSVGASALDLLRLDDEQTPDRRRTMKLRKYARMSLCVATSSHQPQTLKLCFPPLSPKRTPINIIMDSTTISHMLSFLNEGELIHSASLVSRKFADVAAEALSNLMLASVGCDPSLTGNVNDDSSIDGDESVLAERQSVSLGQSTVAKSMERGWPYLMNRFPWAKFLSDGSFKRVYKVWNRRCGAYEALSVMDVDAIDDMGNLNLVGMELAVSVILSSAARRNICPNFVVTRGVFTCRHEPPASHWGCKDDADPSGTMYDGHIPTCKSHLQSPSQCGNYQYIRMELCENGDVEEYIRNRPDKMIDPMDCRNLLFQMAFALHVAGDRFGLKHYDVKLLNFLLQSAKDPSITDNEHPHVVLRYGVGSHIFRLRMHPSTAHIAKLADYGTSVMRSDTDGQPVSLGQYTTLENTPPDFLILGNTAEQGYGHDCFGLGLCMLHLFTGHAPYEEILDEVVCPPNLKGRLQKIWMQKSHDVIYSVMLDNDEDGTEVGDQTLFDTLYRFLVLFGIPKDQFGAKKNGKVWHAINSTLLPPKRSRSKQCPDMDVFIKDTKKFSLAAGTDRRIAEARRRLQKINGAMGLLLSLVSFDPKTRATPLDVINSTFMADLIEDETSYYGEGDIVKSYTAYSTRGD